MTTKKTLLVFLGDVKMGAEERKETMIIILRTQQQLGMVVKVKNVFPEGKEELVKRAGYFFYKRICFTSRLCVMAAFHLQDSACSLVAYLAGQQLWRGPTAWGELWLCSGHGVPGRAGAQHATEP